MKFRMNRGGIFLLRSIVERCAIGESCVELYQSIGRIVLVCVVSLVQN